ncbi:MAG TPA: 2-hydroxyacid dehydrogenase, partial [Cellvibrionaceae bacterium]|nr:2-hydroxyacid dehydrogenase [Cellvibrionaceae bacterium]
MRLCVFSSKPYDEQYLRPALEGECELVFLPVHLNKNTVPLAEGAGGICCFVNDDLSAPVLEALALRGIQFIVLRCAGFNQVDVAAAKRLKLVIARVPEYSPYAVAEHAVALILALNRNIHRAHNRVREGDYSLQGLMGFDLHGKTVGIVGAGKIGRAFAAIVRGFGCTVLICDPVADPASCDWARWVDFDSLMQQSHIVSLHCPLTPHTHHLINARALALMQPGAMLINTSRGALVDARAVIDALKSGHLGYLGLDVYEEEGDLFFEDLSNQVIQDDVFARLTTFPNVLITAHQAFFTHEALTRIAEVTLLNLRAIKQGALIPANLVA